MRELDGNAGRRPLNREEPRHDAPSSSFDDPPRELAGHKHAIAEWQRLAPQLRKARQVADVDRGALVALCLEWDRYLTTTARIHREGMTTKTPNGYRQPHPLLSVARQALVACNRLWPELGLTPSSRARVKADAPPPPGTDDPFAEFDDTDDHPSPRRVGVQ